MENKITALIKMVITRKSYNQFTFRGKVGLWIAQILGILDLDITKGMNIDIPRKATSTEKKKKEGENSSLHT